MNIFKSLKHRAFAFLWSGQTVSRLGDNFYAVALALWVLEKTGSAAAMGLVLICTIVPQVALSLPGGVLVDRFARLSLMLASDLLRALMASLIAFLAASNRLELWHVLVVSAVFGAVEAVFYPAYTAAVPDVVPADALPSANSLRSISLELASIVGPAAAGWVVAQGGTPLAFALNSTSFAISALCLLAVPRFSVASRTVAEKLPSNALQDLIQGVRTVSQSPWLWITIAIAGISNITLSGPFEAALPLLVKERFSTAAQTYGLLLSFAAVGSMLAALWAGWQKRLRRRAYLVYSSWLAASLMLFAMGLPLPFALMSLAICIWGAGIALLGLAWTNSLQELIPPDRLGRVASIDALGSYVFLPVGYGLAGIAADHFGAALVFVVGGLLSAAMIASGLLHPAVRAVD
jgi:MFS family permease